jgi:hypothetical protein
MVDPALKPFVDKDEFLRRVLFKDHIKREQVHWRAFKDNDPRMSLTYRNGSLQSAASIDEYHAYFSNQVGETLPAILRFTFYGLTKRIDPPMVPSWDPAPDDPKYGHLHCSTEAPREKPHMKLLAKLVNDGQHASIAARYPREG